MRHVARIEEKTRFPFCIYAAFTIPLPLFPRIIEWYTSRESNDPNGFLSRTLDAVRVVRNLFVTVDMSDSARKRWDIVLLGVSRLCVL